MDKQHFRFIEKILYNQKAIELAVRDARAEQLANHKIAGGGSGSHISNPTEQQAIKLATPIKSVVIEAGVIRNPEKWLFVINDCYSMQTDEKRKLLRFRYYSQNPSAIRTAIEFFVTKKTVYNYCNRFVDDIYSRATYHHLLNPYEKR